MTSELRPNRGRQSICKTRIGLRSGDQFKESKQLQDGMTKEASKGQIAQGLASH